MKKFTVILFLCLLGLPNIFGQSVSLGGNIVPTSDIPVINADCNASTYTLNPVVSMPPSDYSVASIPYNPPSPLNSGTAFTTSDDSFSSVISLPFNFTFFGNIYNQIVISQNGWVSFNTQYAGSYCSWRFLYNNIPNENMSFDMYNAIYGVMQDMDAYFAGSMYYSTVGTAPNRKFCVSFYNIPLYNCSSMLQSSQIVLYENSNIIEVYISHRDRCTASNNSKGVVGIQNSDGTKGLAPQGRNLEDAWEVSTPEAWRFVPVSYINYFTWYKGSGFNGEIIGTNNNLTLNRGFKERDTVTVRLQNNSGLDVSDSVIVDWGIKVTALYDTITAGEEYIFGNISIYQSNTYTRTLTGSNGCDSIIVLHLAVLPFAPVVLSLENASAENGSIILTWENAEQTQQMIRQRAPSEQQVTYKIYRNGNFLAETTEMRYEDTEVETGENYCYKIRIFLLNDVGSNYSEEVCTMLSALNEVSQNDLQIYPNPVHSELTIKNLELKKGDKIEIYNISGKICMTYDYNFTTINVLNLPKGVYLIKAGNAVRKFVKE